MAQVRHCAKCAHLRRAKKAKKEGYCYTGGILNILHAYYCPKKFWTKRPTSDHDVCQLFEKRKENNNE